MIFNPGSHLWRLTRNSLLTCSFILGASLLNLAQILAQSSSISAHPWGDRLSTSPDAKIILREEKRSSGSKGTVVTYRVRTRGFPAGKNYVLWMKASIVSPKRGFHMGGLVPDESGQLVCSAKQTHNPNDWSRCAEDLADMRFVFSRFHAGEAFEFAVTSEDGTVKTYAKVFPAPLEAKHLSCRLWAERITSDSMGYAIFGEGFVPGEIVQDISRSGNEVMQDTYRIDDKGRLPRIIMLPGVIGKKGGIARYTVKSQSCQPSLTYPWGRENKLR